MNKFKFKPLEVYPDIIFNNEFKDKLEIVKFTKYGEYNSSTTGVYVNTELKDSEFRKFKNSYIMYKTKENEVVHFFKKENKKQFDKLVKYKELTEKFFMSLNSQIYSQIFSDPEYIVALTTKQYNRFGVDVNRHDLELEDTYHKLVTYIVPKNDQARIILDDIIKENNLEVTIVKSCEFLDKCELINSEYNIIRL